jgi:hypothetical protein
MTKRPQDTSAEEPDGGNLHVRIRRGPGRGNQPGLLNKWQRARLSLLGILVIGFPVVCVAEDLVVTFVNKTNVEHKGCVAYGYRADGSKSTSGVHPVPEHVNGCETHLFTSLTSKWM